MRRRAAAKGGDLLVVDTGDRVEGNGLYDASTPKGIYTRRVLRQMDVDLLTPGNHELYSAATALAEHRVVVPHFGARYLSSNIDIDVDIEVDVGDDVGGDGTRGGDGDGDWDGDGRRWRPFANRSVTFTTPNLGLRVMAFGFLFNFTGNANNTRVRPVGAVVQEPWFQAAMVAARADGGVDLFVVAAHIDVHAPELGLIHDAIRAAHPHTPIQFFGGHSHIRDFRVLDARSSALESGRYCETAGFLSLSGIVSSLRDRKTEGTDSKTGLHTFRRYLDFNRAGFQHHSGTTAATFDTAPGLRLSAAIASYRQLLQLDRLLGCAPRDLSLDRAPHPSPGNWYSYLADHILPTMVRHRGERGDVPRIILINGGSQRFDVFRRFTVDSSFLVSPFDSRFVFARDVPWSVARRLLDYFNADPSPYAAEALARGELPAVPRHHADDHTAPLDHPAQPPDYLQSSSPQQPLLIRKRRRGYARIGGYTTEDDYGQTGDDTVHDAIDRYDTPKVLQSNASFPSQADGEAGLHLVDVVFLDFIAPNVAAGLNRLSGGSGSGGGGDGGPYTADGFESYMGPKDTLTALIVAYAQRYWGREC
jgi:hypothetical protein